MKLFDIESVYSILLWILLYKEYDCWKSYKTSPVEDTIVIRDFSKVDYNSPKYISIMQVGVHTDSTNHCSCKLIFGPDHTRPSKNILSHLLHL